MAQKGSEFERDICKTLSRWWLGGESDNVIFWRTAGSGAWATTRKKSGRSTPTQHGDLQAIDPVGDTFVRHVSVEMKRGYSRANVLDKLDAKENSKPQTIEQFLHQTVDETLQSGKHIPLLIFRRDQRRAVIFVPVFFWQAVEDYAEGYDHPRVYMSHIGIDPYTTWYVARLERFLEWMTPDHFRSALNSFHFIAPSRRLRR